MPLFRRLELNTFGIGVLCGLVLENVETLDDSDQRKLSRSFLAAYKVVESEFEAKDLRFNFILDEIHGTSPNVEAIMLWWLQFWATKDAPGTIWRFDMPPEIAEDYVGKQLPGGREVWLKVARAFMNEYRQVYT